MRINPSLARAGALALAFSAFAALTAGCTGASGDYWRERPASSNYSRLPVR